MRTWNSVKRRSRERTCRNLHVTPAFLFATIRTALRHRLIPRAIRDWRGLLVVVVCVDVTMSLW